MNYDSRRQHTMNRMARANNNRGVRAADHDCATALA
jgi:hypothetical protein